MPRSPCAAISIISAADYGFAVGTFYWAYFLFEVPCNVIMEKVGARIWIARIMITWGIFATATAFVTGTTSFAIVRFLLGMGEAGFFPGLILYFTYWFPARHHARIVSGFLVGLPIAVAAGAPISTGLMSLDGLFGLKGWQIMFIAEGLPTIALGLLFYFVMTNKPRAGHLPEPGGEGLADRQDRQRAQGQGSGARLLDARIDVEPAGAAAGAQLLRHRDGEPRHAVLHPADHQVARQPAPT